MNDFITKRLKQYAGYNSIYIQLTDAIQEKCTHTNIHTKNKHTKSPFP